MDIETIVSDDYVDCTPETRVSTLLDTFADPTTRGVVVSGDEFEGVVTRRELATSRHRPDESVGSLVWHVPRLAPDEDIRKVAQLMLDSDSRLLPVFENDELSGIVTVDGVLEAVQPFLDAATIADAVSTDLVTADPSSTVGDTLQILREKRITHIPVVEDETAAGILSLYDLTGFTVRATERQSDDAGETDASGARSDGDASEERAESVGRERGGDAGDARTRLLDRPVRDVMISPVRTIGPSATLDVAVDEMFETGGSSLVVTEDDSPSGIITKTDVLDALTWDDDSRSVQVYGIELAADIADDEIVAMIDELDERDADLSVLDAVVHLHEGDETRHGQSLVRARVRLHTDRGLFIGAGERYGANSALNDARDALEQQLHDERTSDQRTQSRNEGLWEQRFGWLLDGRN